mgnify:CR=1 FL=1
MYELISAHTVNINENSGYGLISNGNKIFSEVTITNNDSWGIHLLQPINMLIKKIGISWFDFSITVRNKIKDKNYKGRFKELFDNFCKESHEEIFKTREDDYVFFFPFVLVLVHD